MKPKIHPEFQKINVTCACGNTFETMSTAKELRVEVCSGCHPFFTGTQRLLDTTGRVEKFKQKIEAHKTHIAENPVKAKKPVTKPAAKPAPEAKKAKADTKAKDAEKAAETK
ncbi:MAG TPA: 50S ribosomal protein L31 [Candidatus Ozemobacteraceae bacterium]|nr:50S ribosomal protein L31 [Candidatus Ozemobacteraceae bacterium]